MSGDLVSILRTMAEGDAWEWCADLEMAADEIERLRGLADGLASAAKDYFEYGDHGSRARLQKALAAYDEARK